MRDSQSFNAAGCGTRSRVWRCSTADNRSDLGCEWSVRPANGRQQLHPVAMPTSKPFTTVLAPRLRPPSFFFQTVPSRDGALSVDAQCWTTNVSSSTERVIWRGAGIDECCELLRKLRVPRKDAPHFPPSADAVNPGELEQQLVDVHE